MTCKTTRPGLTRSVVMCVAALASAAALAAGAWVGVPSAATGGKARINGGALAAWQPVTIQVTDPAGQKATIAATSDAKGALSVDVPTAAKGTHKVDVYDAAGQRIGGGSLIAQ